MPEFRVTDGAGFVRTLRFLCEPRVRTNGGLLEFFDPEAPEERCWVASFFQPRAVERVLESSAPLPIPPAGFFAEDAAE